MRGIDLDSPVKFTAQSDSDTDFQTRGAESDGEDSADEDGGDQNSLQELQKAEARPPRGMVGSQGSPSSGKGKRVESAQTPCLPQQTSPRSL